ncbi:MAG: trypsin-like peptidase domain-containing protein, partial [Candidatus Hydrogenedentes bacterium]|nr:trypsin-like peptidase domain-containing protein [Candidatus Hydrogenedentota bacterium]
EADEVAEKGRAVLEANKAAVITLQTIVEVSFGGQSRESEGEATGTIIQDDGLTIMSLTALDPTTMYENMGQQGGNVVSKVSSVTMLMGDGSEVPAKVILRDKDLDIAFVRPLNKPEAPLPFIDISNAGQPQLLDQIVVLMQLGQVGRREHAVMVDRIESILAKPRTLYVSADYRSRSFISSPGFTLDNQFVGLGVMRSIRTRNVSGMGSSALLVFVSGADIQETLAQVPAWPAPTPEEAAAEASAELGAPESDAAPEGATAPEEPVEESAPAE